jgi:seryl-tRNA synthetase
VEKSIAHLARSAAARRLKEESAELIARHESCVEDLQKLALSLPNLTSLETPVGEEPKVIRYLHYDPHKPPKYLRSPSPSRSHVTIGTELGLIDFTSSATSTGWGWYYLINEGALLENALVQFALSIAQLYGWKPVSPPSIVYSHIADACGFQPRDQNGEQQIWALEQNERDRNKPQRCLSGTAEIPLAAMYAGRDIPVDELPVKLVGASRCYRAEAGARGVDTKGLYRVHEFTKVELFGWADDNPDPNANRFTATSETLFEEMLSIQYRILTALDIPCRVLEMPTADLGASAARKRDIEALFPSRIRRAKPDFPSPGDDEGWGEVTSASICTDYQTRRLGTRVRTSSGEARFPHTVNGTALAVPRIIAAILENGWDEEMQAVVLPKALKPFMGGMDVIRRKA